MSYSSRPARLTIHAAALRHNLQVARAAASHAKIMPAIKADAYGHGMVSTAEVLADADGFIVACISEAIALRDAKIRQPLLVIQGHQSLQDLQVAAQKKIRLVIHNEAQLGLLDQLSRTETVQVALKLDTGMHRLGIEATRATYIYQKLQAHPNVHPDIWLMTHLACADDLENPYTTQQINLFDQATASLTAPRTIANSAGILGWPATHRDWVRPGIMIYGSSPFLYAAQDKRRDKLNLKATMSLHAPLIAIKKLQKGDSIGYGSTWTCPKDMPVGVVACGYADGYPRHAPSGTPVAVNGKQTWLLGRVSMDLIVIDLTEIDAQPGDWVECWGTSINVDEVADLSETISYELFCHAGSSCKKVFQEAG